MKKLSNSVRQRFRSQVDRERNNIFLRKDNLITLIRFYAGHECLWNQLNPDYDNERKRNHIWSWIAKQFGPKTSKFEVEREIKVLQVRALREFERMELYRKMGVKFNSTFDLLDEFRFLFDDGEEVNNSDTDETEDPQLESNHTHSNSADVNDVPDLDVFCQDLKEELSRFPPKICLKAQKKILFIMHSSRVEFDQMGAKNKTKKCVHWNV